MAAFPVLSPLKPLSVSKPKQTHFSSQRFHLCVTRCRKTSKPIIGNVYLEHKCVTTLLGTAGLALTATLLGSSCAAAAELPSLVGSSLKFTEPANALSLPTWTVHVSSVVEWITAMALVWQYGGKTGYESWKGLSWAMVPLLGGAFCACTWHFFYNAESLEGQWEKKIIRRDREKSNLEPKACAGFSTTFRFLDFAACLTGEEPSKLNPRVARGKEEKKNKILQKASLKTKREKG